MVTKMALPLPGPLAGPGTMPAVRIGGAVFFAGRGLGAARHALFTPSGGRRKAHRMVLQRQPRRLVIGDDMLGGRASSAKAASVSSPSSRGRAPAAKQGQFGIGCAADLP